ncbi:uncharacterized protein LOC120338292 [Styela clava]
MEYCAAQRVTKIVKRTIVFVLCLFFVLHVTTCFDPESEFSKAHNCKIIDNGTQRDGFAPYTVFVIECQNISPSVYTEATCWLKCRQPRVRRNLPLTRFRPKPIYSYMVFQVRRGGKLFTHTERIIRACRCVITKRQDRWRIFKTLDERTFSLPTVGVQS